MLISRSPSAQNVRWGEDQAGEELLDGYGLTGRFLVFKAREGCQSIVGAVCDIRFRCDHGNAQQQLHLGTEANDFFVIVVLDQFDGLVVPPTGFVVVAELPMRHRQEDSVIFQISSRADLL